MAMILVVGGLNGFIGSNTTEALVDDLGQNCVVTRHENAEVPRFLQKHIDHHHVIIEPADSTSIADLRKIGEKHKIDGIVNVAGGFASGEGPLRGLQGYFNMLSATFQVAQEWRVKRVTFSSTYSSVTSKMQWIFVTSRTWHAQSHYFRQPRNCSTTCTT